MSVQEYVSKRKFGGRIGNANVDNSGSDEDEDEPEMMNKTPNTKRKIKEDIIKTGFKKLNTVQTFMTLFKGFVCSSVIYVPKAYVNGGYAWISFTLIVCAILTAFCANLLLQVRSKTNLISYSDIGTLAYGRVGKGMVDLFLWTSQAGFCCAYVYFIKSNFHKTFLWLGTPDFNEDWIALGCWVVFTGMCFVRKIEKWASFHIFADVMIFLTLLTVIIYGGKHLKDNGSQIGTIQALNSETWSTAIGFSVYYYEGIGVILPVGEVTAKPESYRYVVIGVIFASAAICLLFGNYCCLAWGDQLTTPLITDQLMLDTSFPEWIAYTVNFLFCFNLLFSFPLIIYPTIMINENYLFKSWPKNKKRQTFKNINRALVVGFVVVLTILLKDKLDKFLSILGAISCTPIAFGLPALFHFKLVAKTTCEKTLDILLLILTPIIMVYCSAEGIRTWNDE